MVEALCHNFSYPRPSVCTCDKVQFTSLTDCAPSVFRLLLLQFLKSKKRWNGLRESCGNRGINVLKTKFILKSTYILNSYRALNTLLLGYKNQTVNPLNAELNPIRHLLALVEARHIVHASRIRVKR